MPNYEKTFIPKLLKITNGETGSLTKNICLSEFYKKMEIDFDKAMKFFKRDYLDDETMNVKIPIGTNCLIILNVDENGLVIKADIIRGDE